MKNRTVAIIGIGSYILSVIVSATDLEGNFIAPFFLIAISGIASLIFIVMATVRLWKETPFLSVILASSAIILFVLKAISKEGSIILLFNITKIINFITYIWAIIKLFKMNDLQIANQQDLAKK